MRDNICTIPVSEIFEEKDGCPICRMRDTAEEKALDYIMGAAMMEPDVRQQTNKKGFCSEHLLQMMSRRGRLPLALMLDSHLTEILEGLLIGKGSFFSKTPARGKSAGNIYKSCFVCDKIDWGMERMTETIYRLYETERDFRELFDSQPMFCLPHYAALLESADKKVMHSQYSDFEKSLTSITKRYLGELSGDVSHYCGMYDYRSTGEDADWGNSRDSVERTVRFLTSRDPK